MAVSTTEISRYFSDKRILAFDNKLKLSDEKESTVLSTDSRIGITIINREKKSNNKKVKNFVNDNLQLFEVFEIFNALNTKQNGYTLYLSKIYGEPNKNGLCIAKKTTIVRNEIYNGQKQKLPWLFKIENGYGRKAKSSTGGYYMEKGTFKEENTEFVKISDYDLLKALYPVVETIKAMNIAYASIHMNRYLKFLNKNKYNSSNEKEAAGTENKKATKKIKVIVLGGATKVNEKISHFTVLYPQNNKKYKIYSDEKALKKYKNALNYSFSKKESIELSYEVKDNLIYLI